MQYTGISRIKVLLDNGIFSHSEFAQDAVEEISLFWAGRKQRSIISGIRRKPPHKDGAFQAEIDLLPTIGQLIRGHVIRAYDSKEIKCERLRYRPSHPCGNALDGCQIETCPPPIDRSKFGSTVNIADYFAKGGKKDIQVGTPLGQANQIAFFKLLCSLTEEGARVLVAHANMLRLTTFEAESLHSLQWFKTLCQRSQSPENYPDVFHLWTAERNGLEVLLTLDEGLPKLVSRVRGEKKKKVEIKTEVLCPSQLLALLGVNDRAPVPIAPGRFYQLHELC